MKKKRFIIAILLLFFMGACKKDIITGTPSPLVSLEDVRAQYQGSPVVLARENMMDAYQICGVVISDPANGNNPPGLLIMQGLRRKKLRGIALALDDASNSYQAGDSLLVNVEGATLDRVNGTLLLSGIPPENIKKISANNAQHINLSSTSFKALEEGMDTYESTLVQIRSAIVPDADDQQPFSGNIQLSDWTNFITMVTQPTASYASATVPALGNYTGIALGGQPDQQVSLWPRSLADIEEIEVEPHRPDKLYANFPEGWENPIQGKSSYSNGIAIFPTGEWQMNDMYLIKSNNITVSKHGDWTLMINKNVDAALEMNFNLPYGASKMSFYYGAPVPGSDTDPSTLRAEYSQDSGETWQPLGPDLTVTSVSEFYFQSYDLDIKGPVRFRISKSSGGARLSVDDIAVYQN